MLQRRNVIRIRNQGVVCRIKSLCVNTVKDADQIIGSRLQNTVQTFSVVRHPDFLSVCRADRDQFVGENDAGFQEIGVAVKLDIVLVEIFIIQPQKMRRVTKIKPALITKVVNSEDGS